MSELIISITLNDGKYTLRHGEVRATALLWAFPVDF
jgi:hypothetical protein